MYRILIAEDDETIAQALEKGLARWGYEAGSVKDFKNVLAEFAAFDPQLVLLDIRLPFFNGYHWCSQIRSISKVPILFVSSASDNMNIVMAMNMGGDDFIAKPFDLEVLIAKIQAMLRRTYDFSGQTGLVEHRGIILSTTDSILTYQEQRIRLPRNEYRILLTLLENKGRIVTREVLMQKLWESDSYVDENTLNVNIARLRRRLEELGLKNFITTQKGEGYLVEE